MRKKLFQWVSRGLFLRLSCVVAIEPLPGAASTPATGAVEGRGAHRATAACSAVVAIEATDRQGVTDDAGATVILGIKGQL